MTLSQMEHENLKQAVFGTRVVSLGPHSGDLKAYLQVYDKIKSTVVASARIPGAAEVAKSFEVAVLAAIDVIKKNPKFTLNNVLQGLQNSFSGTPDSIHELAINTAVRCLTMVNPSARERHSAGFFIGDYRPPLWHPDQTFSDFVDQIFTTNPVTDQAIRAIASQSKLKAWKLQSYYGILLVPTDNLAEHLVYDSNHHSLSLFHHTEFLKAQLAKFPKSDQAPQTEWSVEQSLPRGSLPPQLLAETLHSINQVLFNNASDLKSENLLKKMIAENPNLDRDLKEYDEVEFEFTGQYRYWGQRIADLHRVILANPPRSSLERWFQRHCTDRNALFIALIALLISIIVGLISIGLAVFQSWIAWMAWKYPVQNQ